MAIKKNTSHTSDTVSKQLHQASDQVESKIDHAAEVIEQSMDKYASKFTETVDSKIDPELKKKAHDIADKIDGVAGKVEDVINEVGGFIPHSHHSTAGSTVTIDIGYTESVSRLMIFRFLWLIIQGPIIYIWAIWISVVRVIYILYILIMGKREKTLWAKMTRFLRHTTKWHAFIGGLTDKQPKIIED